MKSIKVLSVCAAVLLLVGFASFTGASFEDPCIRDEPDAEVSSDQVSTSSTSSSSSSADWLDEDWDYRKRLEISDPVDDYQMKLNVSYDGGGNVSCEGNVDEDFSDLRFTGTDGVSTRPYWIEERVNGSYAVTWVNTSGEDTMYMYYGNSEAVSKSNGTETFIAFNESIIVSYGDYTTSGTLLTFENVSNDVETHVHYKYFYQANTNGRRAHIYTDLDGVEVDQHGFYHPYNNDPGADRDDVSTFHERNFVESGETINDEIEFRFSNGDWRVRIADIRVRKHTSPEPVWSGFGGETTPSSEFEVTVLDQYDEFHPEEEVTVEFEVLNMGEENHSEMIEFRVDGDLKDSFELTLGPGEIHEGEFTWTLEDPGEYELVVASEHSEDRVTIEVVEPAHFEVEIIDHDETVVKNEEGTVGYTVTNTGGLEDTQMIEFSVDDISEDSREVHLEGGEGYEGEFTCTLEDPGEYELVVASEHSEDQVTVEAVEPAHFEVEVLDFDPEVVEGETLSIEYMVTNTGGASDTQSIDLLRDGTEVATDEVELETGEEFLGELTWDTEGHPGDLELTVASQDDQDEIAVTILQDAELVVQELLVDGENAAVTVEEDEEIEITAVVENMGDLEGEITVTVYELREENETGENETGENGTEENGTEENGTEEIDSWNHTIEGNSEKEIYEDYTFDSQGDYIIEISEDTVEVEVERALDPGDDDDDDDASILLDYWWVILMILGAAGALVIVVLVWQMKKDSRSTEPEPPRQGRQQGLGGQQGQQQRQGQQQGQQPGRQQGQQQRQQGQQGQRPGRQR